MIERTQKRQLGHPAEGVWAALADFGAIAAWAPDVEHSCLLSDLTGGVGATRRVQLGRTTLVERVTEWDEPTALAYAIDGLPPLLGSVVNRWRIAPADACVLASITTEITPGPRPPHRIVARAALRRFAAAADSMLAGLDHHLSGSEAA